MLPLSYPQTAPPGDRSWQRQNHIKAHRMRKPVYLDNHSTTRIDPRVLEVMLPFLTENFGNAASRSHSFGWEAEKAVEGARQQIASFAGAEPREIVFTSGATESNNLAIKGVLESLHRGQGHIVTMTTEHRAVLDPIKHLERLGCRLTALQPRGDGLLDLDRLREAIHPETALVSIMCANNEIGVIQPVHEIGGICREKGVLFHCDAAQAFGKIPIQVKEDGIGLMSVTAHKIYGPKGIGALYVDWKNARARLTAQIDGGGHERGMRSGTLNVPAIVGFGEACALCACEMREEARRLRQLRDRLKIQIEAGLERVWVNGSMERRLDGNLNLGFSFVAADSLLTALPDLALSTGSACSSASAEPSHVLRAIGLSEEMARSSVRFGLGRFNTVEEVDYAAGRVVEVARGLRARSPAYEMRTS
jgi:cysteine desulfurase